MASRTLVAWGYALVEALVPIGRAQCFMSFPDADDNALAIYMELLNRGANRGHDLVWLVSDIKLARRRLDARLGPALAKSALVVKKNSIRGLWSFMRSRRAFFTHGHYWFVRAHRGRSKLVNLWHGMPLKAIGFLDKKASWEVQASELTIASSKFFQPLMGEAFGLSPERVLITGLPRCDQLLLPNSKATAFRRQVAADAALVVWMPTYRISKLGEVREDSEKSEETLLNEFLANLDFLSQLAMKKACVVIVKLHPMDFLNWMPFESPPRIILLRQDSDVLEQVGVYGLLSVADGLISDMSSVVFDFMVTGKPILVSSNSFVDYSRGLLFDPSELDEAVSRADSVADSEDFFDSVLNHVVRDSSAARKFCEFADTGSASRVLAAIGEDSW